MRNHICPLISIVMIVKNGEKFIRQALKSIYAQDYDPFEIIVVMGNTSDRTQHILKEFEGIRLIHQQGSGISDAYNIGIAASKAEFVAFLSYDDIWTPDKLHIQMNYLLENPEILFTNCHTTYFLEPGCDIPMGFRKEWLTGSHPARIMETLVARKNVFDKVGLFRNDLPTAEDVDWYSRASDLNIPSFMIPKVLLNKRIHGQNNSMDVEKNNQNLLTALRTTIQRKKNLSNP